MSPGAMESIVDESITMRKEEPLLSPVWVLQERILAPRTIQFASYEMLWECSEKTNTEDGYEDSVRREIFLESIAHGLRSFVRNLENPPHIDETRRSHRYDDVMASDLAQRAWFVLIEEYTSRNMSFQSDKLPALSGVISALEELTGDICVAGIWKRWFLHGLLWRLQQPEWDIVIESTSKDCEGKILDTFHHDKSLTASHYPDSKLITLL
ncbi:unnamed protein product [Alternaria alternata]